MINKQHKLYTIIISFTLVVLLLVTNLNLSFAISNTIYIDSAQDLVKFSRDASLDTYFKGKTVVLRSDIDLANIESFTIPTFAGIFEGQGYTISGVSLSKSGSIQGLFRYLQKDGIIRDLNVTGNITPSGSQNIVGGLVGNNKGTIKNCSFSGIVKGKNNIGGLVGINEVTGTIYNCNSEGIVTGEHFTGGIVGQNLGTILKSTNSSEVNTSITEATLNIEDINWSQINSIENVNAFTDTGGIAGLSTGYLQDCVNRGPIGYKHVGYNVGGIVGRQSGYLYNCQNYNAVLGRKDVGGIVGQVEPYLMLLFSEDILQKLDHELNVLQNLLNNSFSNARFSSESIHSQLGAIVESVDDTTDIMQILSRSTVDYIDDVADTVNITNRRIRYTLEELSPILDDAEELSTTLNNALNHIESGFDNLDITSSHITSAINESKIAIENLRQAIKLRSDALEKTKIILEELLDALENNENIQDILPELKESLEELGQSFADGSLALSRILEALIDLDSDDPNWNNMLQELEDLSKSLASISQNIVKFNNAISTLISEGLSEITPEIKEDIDNIFENLRNASKSLDLSIKNIGDALTKLETSSQQSGNAFRDFKRGFNKLDDTSGTMTTVIVSVRDLIDSLVSEPNIELPNISSGYRQSGEDLFASIGNISAQIIEINTELRDTTNKSIDNLEAISNQILDIFNLLLTSRENIGRPEYIEDNYDGNVDNARLGAVYKNQNYGSVNADVNVGGIAGAVAIEYDLDPEDDIFKQGNSSLNLKYLTTAILKNCINHGKITAKKDYSGGIAGRMDLGIITSCENYGDIESTEGDYVGGIAGASDTKIYNSFVLSSLSGRNYIGGIVGYGKNLSNSYTLIDLGGGAECIGSIAGQADGEITNNYYVHDDIAAIDGISYTGKATPLSYDELLKVETLPEAFTEFYLTFIADGVVIDKIPFQYKDSFDLKSLPPIPVKTGYDCNWESFNSENMTFNTTVEAIYTPLKTVISSNLVRKGDDRPLLLAEGKFNEDAILKVSPFDKNKSEFPMKDNKILEVWNVELINLEHGAKETTYRFLLPETKRKVSVWQSENNDWKKLDSSTNGSYIVFTMDGSSGAFCIAENSFPGAIIIIISSIFLIMFFLIRRFKNKDENHEVDVDI